MKNRYWLIKRSGSYYAHDSETGRRESLSTKNKAQAQRLIAAKNETVQNTALNLQLGKVYLAGHDPKLTTRTWTEVMNQLASHGKEKSQKRCRREMDSKPFDLIREKRIVETTGDDLRAVLQAGKSATNNYLHRLHNLAVGLGWLPWPIIPPKLWPKVTVKDKRGVTSDEHDAIIAAEGNAERRDYYQMLWETGAAQSDAAAFSNTNIDWKTIRSLMFGQKRVASLVFASALASKHFFSSYLTRGRSSRPSRDNQTLTEPQSSPEGADSPDHRHQPAQLSLWVGRTGAGEWLS